MGRTPEEHRPTQKAEQSPVPGFKMSVQTKNLPYGVLKAVVFAQEEQRAHRITRREEISFELNPYGNVLIKDTITKNHRHKKHEDMRGREISVPLEALTELPNMLKALKGRRIEASVTLDKTARFTLGDPWNDDSLSLTILDPRTESHDSRTLDLGNLETLAVIVKNLTTP